MKKKIFPIIIILLLACGFLGHGCKDDKTLTNGTTSTGDTVSEDDASSATPTIDPTYTNSIGMEFVLIPAGSFMMGSDKDLDKDTLPNEIPQHNVTLSKPFYLGKYEVTQAQWVAVMGENSSIYKGDDLPVTNVSWNDVQEFIGKLNEKEGAKKYRLPTEAEWEYAARAGSVTVYSFGDDSSQLEQYAWHGQDPRRAPYPVGSKAPNVWGLYDMHGNVYEWVQDWYGDYPAVSVTDPAGPDSGDLHVLRGGGWGSAAWRCRSACRDGGASDHQGDYFGFRLAFSPAQ